MFGCWVCCLGGGFVSVFRAYCGFVVGCSYSSV